MVWTEDYYLLLSLKKKNSNMGLFGNNKIAIWDMQSNGDIVQVQKNKGEEHFYGHGRGCYKCRVLEETKFEV